MTSLGNQPRYEVESSVEPRVIATFFPMVSNFGNSPQLRPIARYAYSVVGPPVRIESRQDSDIPELFDFRASTISRIRRSGLASIIEYHSAPSVRMTDTGNVREVVPIIDQEHNRRMSERKK